MKQKPTLAIVGATGLIGNEIVALIDSQQIPYGVVRLLASKESAGEVYQVGSEESAVEELTEESLREVDLSIFATPADLTAKYIPRALEFGSKVIDTSPFSRANAEIPLVLAEVNLGTLHSSDSVVALPGASAAQLAPVLKVVRDLAGLKRVVISTYQAVSGAGKNALDELWEQTLAIFNQTGVKTEAFQHQIAFNCIPQVDVMNDDGDSREEQSTADEIRRLLGTPSLGVSVTAVRVPVLYSYGQSVNVETERLLPLDQFRKELERLPVFSVYAAPDEYPLPLSVAGSDEIHIGRIRRDASVTNGINLWVVADNVRRGSARSALELAAAWIQRLQAD